MSDSIYYTSDGDTVDLICWKHYKQQAGAVELVLQANHGLSDLGPLLSAGVRVVLPELPTVATEEAPLRLWD